MPAIFNYMNVSEAVRVAQTRIPTAWNAVQCRTYKGADGFGDYRIPYLDWARNLQQCRNEQLGSQNEHWGFAGIQEADQIIYSELHTLPIFDLHKEHDFPFFFVSRSMVDALYETELKHEVDWQDMRLPFPAFTIVFPIGSFFGLECLSVGRHFDPIDTGKTVLEFKAYHSDGFADWHCMQWPFNPSAWIDKNYHWSEFENLAPKFVFNLLYAMAARPEYIETGKRIGTHRKNKSEIWTPNIIGRKYAVKRSGESSGDHASPRMHWRRGHFRHQPYGPNLTETKVIWIEPMLVNAKVDA